MSCFNITHLHRGVGRTALISVAIRGVGKAISGVEDDWRSRSMCTETEEMPNDDESGSWDASRVHRILLVWLVPEITALDWWTRQSEMWWYRRSEWRCRHQFPSTARGLHFRTLVRLFEMPIAKTTLSRKSVSMVSCWYQIMLQTTRCGSTCQGMYLVVVHA